MEQRIYLIPFWLALTVALSAGRGYAEPLGIDLVLFAERQSNITASPQNDTPGFLYRAGLDMDGGRVGRNYRWAIDGSFGYQGYRHDLLDERYDGQGAATSAWFIRPNTFEWNLDYVESRQVINIDEAPLGQNITTLRRVSTGPSLKFNLSEIDKLELYSRRQRIERETDHYYRSEHGARLARRTGPAHEIYVRGEYRKTDFIVGINDYEAADAVAGYAYSGRRTKVNLEFGRGWLQEEESAEPVESKTGLAQLDWRLPADRRLSVSARQRFSDDDGDLQDTIATAPPASVQGTGAFQERRASLEYFGGTRVLSPSVTAWARERRYVLAPASQRDVDERGGSIRTRLFSAATSYVALSYSKLRREFLDDGRLDDDTEADLTLTRLLTPRASLTAGGGWFHRKSSVPGAEYENIVANLELVVELR